MQGYPVPENLVLRSVSKAKPPIAGKLEHVTFEAGQKLWSEHEIKPYAFFPLRGAISLQLSPGAGKRVEVAIVGREGFAGASLVAGCERTRMSAEAICGGEAFIMSRDSYRRYHEVPALRTAIDRYTQLFVTMLSRILVCNRVHVIEKVCVGRLLLIHDRIQGDSLHLTQDAFAKQLGVRRASISRVVTGLQKAGAIAYDRRGRVTIQDRQRLERLACSCYHAIKSEFDRLVYQQGGL